MAKITNLKIEITDSDANIFAFIFPRTWMFSSKAAQTKFTTDTIFQKQNSELFFKFNESLNTSKIALADLNAKLADFKINFTITS